MSDKPRFQQVRSSEIQVGDVITYPVMFKVYPSGWCPPFTVGQISEHSFNGRDAEGVVRTGSRYRPHVWRQVAP